MKSVERQITISRKVLHQVVDQVTGDVILKVSRRVRMSADSMCGNVVAQVYDQLKELR